MSAPSPGTSTRFRLARITGLVLGSLVFLHACERSKSALLSDVRLEVGIAAALGAAALAAAWFEIKLGAYEQDDDLSWDEDEQVSTPNRGNFARGSGRLADTAYGDGERSRGPSPTARRAPTARFEDDDQPEATDSTGPAAVVAGIARTLRIARPWPEGERPQLPALSAVTKWMRRVETDDDTGDDDTGDDEPDDHDELEQITRAETGELVVESSRRTVRAKISRSGDLVLHGRGRDGGPSQSEWKWTFRPDAFDAIRVALGDGPGDLLDLLEDTIPWLDTVARQDPGAWLRAHDIPAIYQEKGVSGTQATRELPVLRPGNPPRRPGPQQPRRQPPRESLGTWTARGSTGTGDDRQARRPARRDRPPGASRSAETPSARGGATERQRPSRGADADRGSPGDASRAAGRGHHRSGDYDSPKRSHPARRDESEPRRDDRSTRNVTREPGPSARPASDRPDVPRRRRGELADDHRHVAGQPDRYADDVDVRQPRTNRRSGRGHTGAHRDSESPPERRDRPDPYRDRPTPSEPPPPDRRHRGDQRPRPDTRAVFPERGSRHGR
ncbi:hypothetical protein ACRS6B_18670 [Nocardia asteroides]